MIEDNIIIFDGVCNLCNWSVQFIIKRDPNALFKFASLQSEFGTAIAQRYGLSPENPESVLLLKDGELLNKSSAALAIVVELSGIWKLLTIFRFVPRKNRDRIYDWVAINRYRWFGKRDECMIPTEELLKRFI
ncbi:MAG: thiol-disulfide oxidoreductase DCC family protein [Anaerolineae bacterium]|jgi:predicted DCC family thiol-disulfide oxidoreductase YuxK|nr:thiol-disulfide oxidoreductase DCC family protein [Anaerolineae bacterium]